jgi:long-chain fatty acid transport protein
MSKSRRAAAPLLAAAALALSAPDARAAGFAIFEQGARGMGFAGAFVAQADDPSAIFHNAAGIAFLHGKHVYIGGTLVRPSTSFEGADPFPGSAVREEGDAGIVTPPAAYYTQQFTDRIVLGMGFHTPFGLRTRWASPDTFSGRYLSTRAELRGFSLNPTVAYRLADRFAVGAGLDIRLSSVQLDRRVPFVNPFTQSVADAAEVRLESDTALGFGFNLGALAKISDTLSAGFHYRHKVKADYEGTATFNQLPTGNPQIDARLTAVLPAGSQPVTTAIEFPAIVSGGVAWKPGDWTFELDVDWYQWSTFRRLDIVFTQRTDLNQGTIEDYRDSFQYRFGAERRLDETWTVRGGYFFDESPAPTASVTPLLPDSDRHGLALGGTWRRGRLHLDAASWFIVSPSRSTEGVNRDSFDGSYKNSAVTFGLFLGYDF